MNTTVSFILSLSCAIPAGIGILYYKRVDKIFHPFILALMLALFIELLVGLNNLYFQVSHLSYYAYYLFTFLNLVLYSTFFYRAGIYKKQETYRLVLWLFGAIWFFIWVFLYPKEGFFSLFRITLIQSIIILISAVELFNRQIFLHKNPPLFNPLVIISGALLVYHAYFIFLVALMLMRTKDGIFMNQVFDIQKFINVFCYLLFTWAILCIPKIKSYIK